MVLMNHTFIWWKLVLLENVLRVFLELIFNEITSRSAETVLLCYREIPSMLSPTKCRWVQVLLTFSTLKHSLFFFHIGVLDYRNKHQI